MNPPSTPIAAALALCLALAGCGRQQIAPSSSSSPPPEATLAQEQTPLEAALSLWEHGDKAGAVQRFVEADWKSHRMFSPGSPLSMTEKDLMKLPPKVREERLAIVMKRVETLSGPAKAVRDKGVAAAATDQEQARRCFAQLDECGAALDQPEALKIVQLYARVMRKMRNK
jgi:hypothetical protein